MSGFHALHTAHQVLNGDYKLTYELSYLDAITQLRLYSAKLADAGFDELLSEIELASSQYATRAVDPNPADLLKVELGAFPSEKPYQFLFLPSGDDFSILACLLVKDGQLVLMSRYHFDCNEVLVFKDGLDESGKVTEAVLKRLAKWSYERSDQLPSERYILLNQALFHEKHSHHSMSSVLINAYSIKLLINDVLKDSSPVDLARRLQSLWVFARHGFHEFKYKMSLCALKVLVNLSVDIRFRDQVMFELDNFLMHQYDGREAIPASYLNTVLVSIESNLFYDFSERTYLLKLARYVHPDFPTALPTVYADSGFDLLAGDADSFGSRASVAMSVSEMPHLDCISGGEGEDFESHLTHEAPEITALMAMKSLFELDVREAILPGAYPFDTSTEAIKLWLKGDHEGCRSVMHKSPYLNAEFGHRYGIGLFIHSEPVKAVLSQFTPSQLITFPSVFSIAAYRRNFAVIRQMLKEGFVQTLFDSTLGDTPRGYLCAHSAQLVYAMPTSLLAHLCLGDLEQPFRAVDVNQACVFGWDLNTREAQTGDTVLHYLAKFPTPENRKKVSQLLMAGADPVVRNFKGQFPHDFLESDPDSDAMMKILRIPYPNLGIFSMPEFCEREAAVFNPIPVESSQCQSGAVCKLTALSDLVVSRGKQLPVNKHGYQSFQSLRQLAKKIGETCAGEVGSIDALNRIAQAVGFSLTAEHWPDSCFYQLRLMELLSDGHCVMAFSVMSEAYIPSAYMDPDGSREHAILICGYFENSRAELFFIVWTYGEYHFYPADLLLASQSKIRDGRSETYEKKTRGVYRSVRPTEEDSLIIPADPPTDLPGRGFANALLFLGDGYVDSTAAACVHRRLA